MNPTEKIFPCKRYVGQALLVAYSKPFPFSLAGRLPAWFEHRKEILLFQLLVQQQHGSFPTSGTQMEISWGLLGTTPYHHPAPQIRGRHEDKMLFPAQPRWLCVLSLNLAMWECDSWSWGKVKRTSVTLTRGLLLAVLTTRKIIPLTHRQRNKLRATKGDGWRD